MGRDQRWLLVPVLLIGVTFLGCHGFAEAQQKPIPLTYSHFFVANQNILLIDDETQAVLAKYRTDDKPLHLLVALYPDAAKAKEAGQSFLRNYLPDASEGVSRLPDGRWTACLVEGKRLSIVFNAPSQEAAISFLGMIGTGRQTED